MQFNLVRHSATPPSGKHREFINFDTIIIQVGTYKQRTNITLYT